MARRQGRRSRHARARDHEASVHAGRRVRSRDVLSGGRPHAARARHQHVARVTELRGVGNRCTARYPELVVHAGGKAARGRAVDRAPQRRRADVLRLAAAAGGRDVDANAARNLEPARARVHGRGRRLLATDGDASLEEAAADAAQASARVRCRHGAREPEPGRPRLQGAVECGHVVPRPVTNRARQGARDRGPRRCERRRRCRVRQGCDGGDARRADHAHVRDEQRARRSSDRVPEPVRDELPRGPADPRRSVDSWRP